METQYKGVIEQRRSLLVERVVWSNKFREKLRKAGIMPRCMLDEIELEYNHGNRTYLLLARMVKRKDPTLYQRFCDVLTSSGQETLANLLLQDRKNIVWDFNTGHRIQNIEDYVNVINEALLQRIPNMEDPHIRTIIVDEVHRRVTRLYRFLLDEMHEHKQLRITSLAFMRMVDSKMEACSSRSHIQTTPYLVFDNILEVTQKKNRLASQFLQQFISDLEKEKESLTISLADGQTLLEECKNKVTQLEKAAAIKGDVAFMYFQNIIVDQDNTIESLRNTIKSFKDYVNLQRGDLVEILSSIRSTSPRANSLIMPKFTDEGTAITQEPAKSIAIGDSLRQHVKSLIDLVEQLKKRGQQTTCKLVELEQERGTLKTLLNARGGTPLPTLLSQQLKSFREQKFEMTNTLRQLRKRLQEVEAIRNQTEKKLEDLTLIMQMEPTEDNEEQIAQTARKKSIIAIRRTRRVSSTPSENQHGKLTGYMTSMTDLSTTPTSPIRHTVLDQYVNMQVPSSKPS